MTDLHDYDDDFYEDDFTDDDDGRGSSKLLETSKSIAIPKPPPKRTKAFSGRSNTSMSRTG